MKVGTRLFVAAVLVCGMITQAQAIVNVHITNRTLIEGTNLEQLVIGIETDGSVPIIALDMVITSPVGTMNQEIFGVDSPVFQNDAVNNDAGLQSIPLDPRFVERDTFWLFDQDDLQVATGQRSAPNDAFLTTGEGTTAGLSPNVDYLAGAFAWGSTDSIGDVTSGPQEVVVNDDLGPFTSRDIAQVVVQQGTQLTLALANVAGPDNMFPGEVAGVGQVIQDIPEPAGLLVGVCGAGLMMMRRRRTA